MNFIDAHVHIWTNDFRQYPLAPGYGPEGIRPPIYSATDILREATPCGVARVVLVQMSFYGTDNRYMLDAIERQPGVFRGIAVVDPESPAPDQQMVELARHGVRGFRIYPPAVPSRHWLAGDGFTKMFRCGAEHSLAMCLLANPADLSAVDQQCARFVETPVVIDHLARIGRDGSIRGSDVEALAALARYPQVKVKVSAFYALGSKQPPHLDLVPVIKCLYEAYGPQRLMWASDCPFQTERESYEDSLSLVRDRLEFLSADNKDWLLRKTAEETFFGA